MENIETKNPFTVMEFNIDDVTSSTRSATTQFLIKALENLPINKNKCVCVNRTHFKDERLAYSAIQSAISYIKQENKSMTFKTKTKKDIEKKWTGTYTWRIS